MTGRVRRLLARPDRGALAPAVPFLALVILLLGGLIMDSSRELNARGRALAYAEEAARAGAEAIDNGSFGLALLPKAEVEDRVNTYCRNLGDPTVQCTFVDVEPVSATDTRPLVVVVHTRITIPAGLLGIVGVDTLSAQANGRARPFEGQDEQGAF